ncbi:hypothetical protein [Serratia nevei]|uniref:hypothetical protein n=1 Tax=Serratia nevei TaxID=2703794 RepID=UPI00313DD7F5
MRNVEIVEATHGHIAELLPRVRQADVDEFQAMSGKTPAQVLDVGLRASAFSYAGLINGQVVTIFGVAPRSIITGSGVPWLVGSDLLEQYQATFLRRCRPALRFFLQQYPVLENYVDERNIAAKCWLHWLGFTIHDAKPTGLAGLPFHRFEMRRGDHV